jgi:protein SCO1/2
MKRAACVLTVIFAVCAIASVFVFVLTSVPPVSASNNASDVADLAFQPHPGARLPLGVEVVDEDGRTVRLGDYFTKSPVILVLEYLRCTSLCGVTIRNLVADTLNRLPLEAGRDYQLVTVSIDPRDKPPDAASARAKYGGLLERDGKSGLHFLTAAPAVVREIADTLGFRYRYDSFLDAYIHPAGFVIAAPDGIISRYVEGIAISPQGLIGALADAQQDKSPDLLTRISLLCHVQGVPLGRFTAPIMIALMLANIVAGLTLVGLFVAIRRQA